MRTMTEKLGDKVFVLVLLSLCISATTDAASTAYDQELEALRALIGAALESDGSDGYIAEAADENPERDVVGEDVRAFQSRRQNNVENECPPGYTAHGDACFKAYDQPKTYGQARQVCADEGGLLAMPKSEDMDSFLWNLKNALDQSSGFWLGLSDENSESEWRWEDGSPHDKDAHWDHWRPGEPNNAGNNEDCAHYSGVQHTGWNDVPCSGTYKFICQLSASDIDDCADNPCAHGDCVDGVNSYTCTCNPGYEGGNCDRAQVIPTPVPPTELPECPPGYTAHGDACFKAYDQPKTYGQARQVCADEGGLLAMPKSEDLDNFLWDLKNALDQSSGFWLGLSDENSESEWRWEDGSPHDKDAHWDHWRPGEPNNAGNNEDCAHYSGVQHTGWNDVPCSGTYKFICQLKPGTEPSEMSASTTCTNDYMELSIPDHELTDINMGNLHWEPDRSCVATTNGTHYLFRTELYKCGTQVTFDSKYVTFRNTIDILGVHKTNGVITREGNIKITSICKYERLEWVDSTFLPIRGGLNFTEEGFGQLEVHLSMFPTRQYQSQYRANQYPIHLKLRQNIYMQLEVQGHGQNLAVLALNCKATMTPEPNGSPQYELIKEGCASDPTLDIYSIQDPTRERFGFEAFRFVQEVKMVYVHCEVMVCNAADSDSRCAQGCVKRGKRASGHNVDMQGRHMIYQGPIMLDGDQEDANILRLVDGKEGTPHRRSAPWAMMAAGGGLMALALVVLGAAIVLKRSRREEWAYKGLANMEEQE